MNVSLASKFFLLLLLVLPLFSSQINLLHASAAGFTEKWSTSTGLSSAHLVWTPGGTYLVVWDGSRILVYFREGGLRRSLEYRDTVITSTDACYDNRRIVLTAFNEDNVSLSLLLYDFVSGSVDSRIVFNGVGGGGAACSKLFPRLFIVTQSPKTAVSFKVYSIGADGGLSPDYVIEDNGSTVKLFSWSRDSVEASYVVDDVLRIVSGVAPYPIRRIYAPPNTFIVDYVWSPDNMYLAVVFSNGKIAVYNILGEQLWYTRLDSTPTSIEWSKNIIVVADADGSILLYKWLGPDTKLVYSYDTGLKGISDIALDNSGSLLGVLSYDGVLKVYDVYGVLEYYSSPLIVTTTVHTTITSTILAYTTRTITSTSTRYVTTTYYTRTSLLPVYVTLTTTTTLTTEYTLTSTAYTTTVLTETATALETTTTTITDTMTSTIWLTDTYTTTLTSTLTSTMVSYPRPKPTQPLMDGEDLFLGLLVAFATSVLSLIIIRRAGDMR